MKLVLAARISMRAVAACRQPYSTDPAAPLPYTSLPISDTTVGVPDPNGRAWARAARTETPEEHRPQDGAHDDQGGAGVVGLWLAEHADAVGDGLGTGHGRPAVGERPSGVEQRDSEQQPAASWPNASWPWAAGDVAEVPPGRRGPGR